MNLLKIRDGATKLFFPDIIKAIMIEGEIVKVVTYCHDKKKVIKYITSIKKLLDCLE